MAILSFGGACVSGMFFDGGTPSIMINAEDELEAAVNGDISIYFLTNYKDLKGVYADVTSIEEDGDYYHVYGKVTGNDIPIQPIQEESFDIYIPCSEVVANDDSAPLTVGIISHYDKEIYYCEYSIR